MSKSTTLHRLLTEGPNYQDSYFQEQVFDFIDAQLGLLENYEDSGYNSEQIIRDIIDSISNFIPIMDKQGYTYNPDSMGISGKANIDKLLQNYRMYLESKSVSSKEGFNFAKDTETFNSMIRVTKQTLETLLSKYFKKESNPY